MERRINSKIETYIGDLKNKICNKINEKTTDIANEDRNDLLQYVYDFERLLLVKDDFSNHKDYQVIQRDGGGSGTLFGYAGYGYNPVMGIDPEFVKKYDGLLSGDEDGGFGDPSPGDESNMGTFFGDDYETYAYITNQPKYFSVNWLIRIEDDTSVALVDDTTFRKLNADGINDDGSLLSAQGLSPLTLTNLPTSDPEVLGAVWNDSNTLKVSAG